MNITLFPTPLRGEITPIPSKSQAHRLLILAAFADAPSELLCAETNRDIEATADCLNALGADIRRTDTGYIVHPVRVLPEKTVLNCCESGSTLRFLLPVAGALGVDATFLLEGRLPQRPLSPMWEEMERMGCSLSRPTPNTIHCTGKLCSGHYTIDGGVSSQYITGFLLALSLLDSPSTLEITGKLESAPYVDLTKDALRRFGADPEHPGLCKLHSPGTLSVEADWSNAAFFLGGKYPGKRLGYPGSEPQFRPRRPSRRLAPAGAYPEGSDHRCLGHSRPGTHSLRHRRLFPGCHLYQHPPPSAEGVRSGGFGDRHAGSPGRSCGSGRQHPSYFRNRPGGRHRGQRERSPDWPCPRPLPRSAAPNPSPFWVPSAFRNPTLNSSTNTVG